MPNEPISATEFRNHLGEYMDDVLKGRHVIVARFSAPFGVFLPYSDYVEITRAAAQHVNPLQPTARGLHFSDGT